MSKNKMAAKLGYEYLGKGFDEAGNEGFMVRVLGTSNTKVIGYNMEQANEWLSRELEYKEEMED